jgi:hypothetical protein
MPTTIINRNVFAQVNHDSGSLTSATTVVHRFSEPGEYRGLLLYAGGGAGKVIREFTIVVNPGGQKTSSQGRVTKVDIDLRSLHVSEGHGERRFEIEGDGWAAFRVPSEAAGGYAVEVYKARGGGVGSKVFDSRRLAQGDVLGMVVLRPGVYSVANAINGAKAELRVGYPERNLARLEPVKVTCTGDSIRPGRISVRSTQGLVFNFETPSRVKVELTSPEDRPRQSRPPFPRVGHEKTEGKSGSSSSTRRRRKKSKVSRVLALFPRQAAA